MAKKKKAATRRTEKPAGSARVASSRKTAKYVDSLLEKSRGERETFVETAAPEELLSIFEQSYASDLVNLLLDLKKATVKRVLQQLAKIRKRSVVEISTLYYYKEYLTNPLPLELETADGSRVANSYAILGVPRDAKDEDLKQAHRLLSKAHGPEMFSPAMRKMGDERLEEINIAYNQLKNPQRREKTDRLLPNINYLYPRRDQSWLEFVHRVLL